MEKIKSFFSNRDNIKNIILVIELILILFLTIKCIHMERKIGEYQDEENNMIVQKVQLPDIEEIEESYKEETVSPQSNTINTNNNAENMVTYFKNSEKELDTISLKEKAKEKFIEAVDFVFYDKEINGYTFKELPDKAKIEITKLLMKIDEKIEKKFPGYKEEIKESSTKTYRNIKDKAMALYLDTTVKVCNEVGSDTCNQAKEDFSTMKASYKLTFENLKKIFKYSKENIKDWYEIYKN